MNVHRPKLMLFSHICSPVYYTGAEKLLLSLAKEMHRLFHCVLVVPKEGAIANAARQHGIEVRVLDIPLSIAMYVAMPHLHSELQDLRMSSAWERLVSLLRSERPSYVWVNTCVHPLPAIAAKALGIPTIWALMETIMDGSHRHEAARVVDLHSDRIVGISRTVLSPFNDPDLSHKTTVLSPFLNRDELLPDSWAFNRLRHRRSHGWGEQHRVAGYIASTIYPNKGLKEFLQALLPTAASDSRVRLLVVGNPTDDDYMLECKELVRKAGLSDRVAWVRFAERIEYVYPAMDLVVVPSLVAEGFGMAALEGMMFGKAVVSFASGGLAEIHEATNNGDYLVERGDVEGLSKVAAVLLQDDEKREAVGRRSAKKANELFGVEAFRHELEAFAASLPLAGEELPSLVKGSGPAVYWVEHGRKRPFPSAEAFLAHGFRFEDVTELSDERLAMLPYGEPMPHPGAERESKGKGASRSRRRRVRRRAGTRAGARRRSGGSKRKGKARRRGRGRRRTRRSDRR